MNARVSPTVVGSLSRWRLLAASLVLALVASVISPWGISEAFASTGTITSVSPSGDTTAGGATVTIDGSGFGTDTAPTVTIGGHPATHVTLVSDSRVTATVPSGSAGVFDVVVTPAGGEPIVAPLSFEYSAALVVPVFDSIAPAVGPTTGGDPVTISGSNLHQVTAIRFGSVIINQSQFLNVGSGGTSITITTPFGALGATDVTLIASLQEVTKTAAFTYQSPRIAAVTPAAGPTTGGTAVTIVGSGFGVSGIVSVTIGGAAATSITRVDSTRITATSPAGSAGLRNVVVTVTGASGAPGPVIITRTGAFEYSVATGAPTLTTVSPNSGPLAGGQSVVLSGTNFVGSNAANATVTFGGIAAEVVSVASNGRSMTVRVPANSVAGPVDVAVTSVDGRATLRNGFTYSASATITSIEPSSGITQGGNTVTVTGSNFGTSGVPTITVGGKVATCVARLSDTVVTFVTPSGTAGARDVEITPTTRGGAVVASGGFTYVPSSTSPTIGGVSPWTGLVAGGTSVTISGSGFGSTTPTVLVAGACASSVTLVDSSTIIAVVPSGAVGARDVTVVTATGTVTASGAFTYLEAPAVIGVSPSSGPTTGGTAISITGRGFGTSGTPTVTIGGVAASSIVRVSDTQVTAVVPPGAAGGKAVVVTPVGGDPLTKTGAFTYQAPTVTSVIPFAGPAGGGTPVIISGTGFGTAGTPTVTFGGAPATSVTRLSATQLTAVTPAGTEGYAAVVVTPSTGSSSGTNATAYSYVSLIETPRIITSLPTRGPSEGGIRVYISGMNLRGSDGVAGTVAIGSVPGTAVTVNSDGTSMTFTAPALSPGHYDVRVRTNEGEAIIRYAYRVSPPPGITGCESVSPHALPPSGGSVTITGTGFGTSGTPAVTVGGVPVTVTASSDTSVTVTVPAGPIGYPSIVITPTTGGGAVTLNSCLWRTTNLTVEANDKSIDFGDPSPTFTSTVSGLVSPDVFSSVVYVYSGGGYGPTTVVPTAAGVYAVTPSQLVLSPGQASYYSIHYVSGTFTINGLEASVTANSVSKVYGNADPDFTAFETGLASGQSLTGVSFSFTGTGGTVYGPSSTPPTEAGSYRITPESALVGGETANYEFEYIPGTYTITPRPVTVAADPATKVYGSDDPALTYQITAGDLAGGALDGYLTRDSGDDVESYAIRQGTLGGPNYAVTFVSDDFTITPKPIIVRALDSSKQYGAPEPTLYAESADLVYGDHLTGSPVRLAGTSVGQYTINRGSVSAGPNYEIVSFATGIFTISKRFLELTLENKEKTYGDSDPSFTYVITDGSLLSGDTISGAAIREAGDGVGTRAINSGTLSAGPNYELSVYSAELRINPRPITVTGSVLSKVFGEDDPESFAYTVTSGELVAPDALTGALGRESGSDVGAYLLTPGTLSAGENYEVTVTGGSLSITPRPITITADAKTKVYGQDDPSLTYQVTTGSLVDGAPLWGSLTRGGSENVGSHAITQGDLDSENYDITFVSAFLSITAKPIVVFAVDDSKEYGDVDPLLEADSYDLEFGDTLSGRPTRTGSESVGTYDIVQGPVTAGSNYTITFTEGEFEITKRSLTITVDEKQVTFGTAPVLSFSTGDGQLLGGDTVTSVTYSTVPTDAGTHTITASDAVVSGGAASNYAIDYYSGTLTIDPLSVEVTAEAKSKVFGGSDPVLTFTTDPAIDSGEFSGSLSRDSGDTVGTYGITQGTLSVSSNYVIDFAPGILTITQRPITVTADAKTKVYGQDDPELTYQVADDTPLVDGAPLTGLLIRDPGTGVGNYEITQGELDNANYDITFVPANLAITAKPITIYAVNNSKEYGDVDPTLEAASDDLEVGDTLTGSPVRAPGSSVTTYAITVDDVTAGPNYTVTERTAGVFTITPRSLTITVDNEQVTFGQTPTLTFSTGTGQLLDDDEVTSVTFSAAPTDAGTHTISASDAVLNVPAGNYTIDYVDGTLIIDPLTVEVTADPQTKVYGAIDPELTFETDPSLDLAEFSGGLTRAGGPGVGTYSITQGTLAVSSNYEIDFTGNNFVITPRLLSVTADAKTKVYGQADPELTYTVSDDTPLVSGDSLSGSLARGGTESVGSHAITQGDLDNDNYDITFQSANLTISAKPIRVLGVNNSKQYGDVDPPLTADSEELEPGDVLSGTPTREGGSSVGTYDIVQGSVTAGSNYTITFEAGEFEITKRSLTITVDDKQVTFGTAPTLTFSTGSGQLLNEDSVTGVTFSAAPTNAGTHEITASDAVIPGGAGNYEIEYRSGTLKIDPLTVAVTANPQSKVFGDADPALTFQRSPAIDLGEFSGSLSRESGDTVGTYDIEQGTLAVSSNYEIDFTPGILTITQRPITVIADATSKVYGQDDPPLTYQVSNETPLVSGAPLSGSLARGGSDNVGLHAIAQGDLGNENYDITFQSANLSITAKPITVYAVNNSKMYGDADPFLTAASDDLEDGDTLTGAPVRAPGSDVATYAISVDDVTAGSNYTIATRTAGVFSITAKTIRVTANDRTVTYGDANVSLTYSHDDLVGTDDFTGALTREPGLGARDYGITQGTLALSANYAIEFTGATYTIEPKAITITADPASKEYGSSDPASLPFTAGEGFLDGDTFTGNLVRESGETVGTYPITPGTLDAGPNYSFTVVGGTFTITPREIGVTANAATKIFGETDPPLSYVVEAGGLLGEDALIGTLARSSGTSVGSYPIEIGTLGNSNYEIDFTGASLTITAKPIIVTAQPASKVYGAPDPTFAASADGLVGGDELTGSPSRVSGDAVGTYALTWGTLAASSNYEITEFVSADLTVSARPLTVTLDNDTKVYGQPDPASFGYEITTGDLVGLDTITGSASRAAGENVGDYVIGAGTLAVSSNYVLTVEEGEFSIAAKELVVTIGSATANWGEDTPAVPFDSAGLISGDSVSGVEYRYNGSATAPTAPGTYTVTLVVTGFESGPVGNYDITLSPGNYTIDGPYVVGIDPDSGLTFGGFPFEIRGSGLGFDSPVVLFDGIPASGVTLVSPGLVTGFTPEHAEGVVTVTVRTTEGDIDLVDAYTYVLPVPGPGLYTLAPASGPAGGGTEITITGENLRGTDGEPAVVLIDGNPVTDVVVSDDGLFLTAKSPAGVIGARDVDLFTSDGGLTFFDGFTYFDLNADLELKLSIGDPVEGAEAEATAIGLQEGAGYTITLRSTPQILATGTVPRGGTVTQVVVIPPGLEAGWHSLTFSSTWYTGVSFDKVVWFLVGTNGSLRATSSTAPVDAAGLASTGSTPPGSGLLTVALGLSILGLAMVSIRRRREAGFGELS